MRFLAALAHEILVGHVGIGHVALYFIQLAQLHCGNKMPADMHQDVLLHCAEVRCLHPW